MSDKKKNYNKILHRTFSRVVNNERIKQWCIFCKNWNSKKKYEKRLFPVTTCHEKNEEILANTLIDENDTELRFVNNKTHTSKYTPLTFIPLNLFEQFRRTANIYFLCTLILTMVLPDSPISPSSWFLSLLFVVAVTMVKQGYEDYLRHQSDREANETKVTVIRNNCNVIIESQHIEVGDIIQLSDNEQVPCDIVVLSTSSNDGECYVMTANLDGETNMKTRYSASLTKELKTVDELSQFVGYIECENANPNLNSFHGRMEMLEDNDYTDEQDCSLSLDNLLLAGTVLKNTQEIYGVCVYSGIETKISMNAKITRIKFSTIEKSLNKFLKFFISLLITELVISTICSLTLDLEYKDDNPWYLNYGESTDITAKSTFHMLLLWLVLYNYIIPISMYVSIEMQKFVASKFVPWDNQLYDNDRDIRAKCNTSDINEELGLVTHLFTDKTGTLTQNIMQFQKYSRDGLLFDKDNIYNEEWSKFLMVMTLCHSVKVSNDSFIASSPDEKALLETCKEYGYEFLGEDISGESSVRIPDGTIFKYKKIADLEFDSFRKRMSVIVMDENHNVHLLSKGAEVSMLPRCKTGPVEETTKIVDHFATEGLRTLVLAHRELSQQELKEMKSLLNNAKQAITDRNQRVLEAYEAIEKHLTVVGATGIEDRLQYNVKETIVKVREAGITTWMLTGDKKETAISLAHAAGLLESDSDDNVDMCDLEESSTKLILKKIRSEINIKSLQNRFIGIYIDGKTIGNIMSSKSMIKIFYDICLNCSTVIACRLSPIQKSQLVKMVKDANPKNLTAAIGDGGNDISMIQEAHVGLGIVGLEGLAASKAGDFSFTSFYNLQRLLFVHGHWFYRRLSFVVQYSFYKNVGCFTCQFFYAIDSNWSGSTLYDSMFLFMFNTLYTLLPVLAYGFLEQDQKEEDLIDNANLYKVHRGNVLMSFRQLSKWLLIGFWHATVCYYGWRFMWPYYSVAGDDLNCYGALIAFNSVIVLNLKILIESKFWNLPLLLTIFFSILSYLFITLLYDQFLIDFFFQNSLQFRTLHRVIDELSTWMGIILLTVIALFPDFMLQLTKPWWKKRKFNLSSAYRIRKRNVKISPSLSL